MRLAGARVVEYSVAVGERPALGVLPREPDRDAVLEQGRERERLGLPPVDPALVERLAAPLELLRELRVHLEAVGDAEQLLVQLAQTLGGHGGDDGRRRCPAAAVARPAARARRKTRGAGRATSRSASSVRSSSVAAVLLGDDALGHEPRRVRLANGPLLLDPLGHERLGVRGLVLLVVAEPAVADEVDDDVVAELLAIREREPDGRRARPRDRRRSRG